MLDRGQFWTAMGFYGVVILCVLSFWGFVLYMAWLVAHWLTAG